MANAGKAKQRKPRAEVQAPLSFTDASKVIGDLPNRVFTLCRSYLTNTLMVPKSELNGDRIDDELASFVRNHLDLVADANEAVGVVGPYAEQIACIYDHVSQVPKIGTISGSSAHEVCLHFWLAYSDKIRGLQEWGGGFTAERLRPFWDNQLAVVVGEAVQAYIRNEHDRAQVRITLQRERRQILQPPITEADWEWRSAQEIAVLVPEAERVAFVKKLRRKGNAKQLSADCYRKVKPHEDDDRLAHQPDHLYRSAFPEIRALIGEYLPT